MNRIYFNEVALRDGFQIEPTFIPTETRAAPIMAAKGGSDLSLAGKQLVRIGNRSHRN